MTSVASSKSISMQCCCKPFATLSQAELPCIICFYNCTQSAPLQICCSAHLLDVCRSIKQFTDEYKQKKYPLHVLLNNAAIQSPKGKRGAKTEDGFEVCLAIWQSYIYCNFVYFRGLTE